MDIITIDNLFKLIEDNFKSENKYKNVIIKCRVLKVMSYQWYSFINLGSLESQLELTGSISNYILKDDIEPNDILTIYGNIEFNQKYGKIKLNIKKYKKEINEKNNYEKVYEKLEKSGLLKIKKKNIPEKIRSVAIISSYEASGLKDFIDIVFNSPIKFYLFDSRMQGESTEDNITKNLKKINDNYDYIDTICIIRGGGAKSDLDWLNNYQIARRIKKSNIPVVCGIGHETDNTILDIVCDYTCTTPSNLAHYIYNTTEIYKNNLNSIINNYEEKTFSIISTIEKEYLRIDSVLTNLYNRKLNQIKDKYLLKTDKIFILINYILNKIKESNNNSKLLQIEKVKDINYKYSNKIEEIIDIFNKVDKNSIKINRELKDLINNNLILLNKSSLEIINKESDINKLLNIVNNSLESFNPKILIKNKQIFTKKDFNKYINELSSFKIKFIDGIIKIDNYDK